MNTRFKYIIVSLSTLLVAVLLFGAVHSSAATTSNDQPYRHLAVFSEVLQYIKSSYVEEPNLKGVTAGALVDSRSVDPFASYLTPDLNKQYEKEKGTKKGDIGLVLARRVGCVSVVVPVPGGDRLRR